MTAEQLAAKSIDFRAALEFAARAQARIDRLEAIAAEGMILDQAQRDALSSAIATFDRELGFALDVARRNGVDFVVVPLPTCDLCYALENGRWEGFVSRVQVAS